MKTASTLLILVMMAASAKARPIYTTYIVPDGYRGPIVLILKKDGEIKLPPPTAPWTFTFPDSGVLEVDQDSYRPIHSSGTQPENYAGTRAHYESGAPLATEGNAADDAVAFRSVYGVGPSVEKGRTSTGAIYFFVGTREEAENFKAKNQNK